MRVSPNTIKQFVRIIMSKMGVTNRSGIIGKLIPNNEGSVVTKALRY
jgi:DNA-binding CsgD family transcriptional regulator